jgi:HEPN domain-containing protein
MDKLTSEKAEALEEYWRRGSQEDFETAKEIFARTSRYTSSLFYAHFSVEKLLKAELVKKTQTHAPYTQNLLHLITKLELEPSESIRKQLTEINEFNMEGRYPDQKFSFSKKATKEYTSAKINDVQEVLQWILLNSSKE